MGAFHAGPHEARSQARAHGAPATLTGPVPHSRARAGTPRMRAAGGETEPPEGPAAVGRVTMERAGGLHRPGVQKAARKKRRASPLPGAAALPGSRAGVSQMCRRRLFCSAGPRGPEPACKRLFRAAAERGVQEAGPLTAGKVAERGPCALLCPLCTRA